MSKETKNFIKELEERLGGNLDYLLLIPVKYKEYESRAKSKNIEFKLNFPHFDYLVKKPCHYCGTKSFEKPNGIDRVNNKRGYFFGNVVPCCWTCNRAKSNMAYKDFQNYIRRFKK